MTELNYNKVTPDLFEDTNIKVGKVLEKELATASILKALDRYLKKMHTITVIWAGVTIPSVLILLGLWAFDFIPFYPGIFSMLFILFIMWYFTGRSYLIVNSKPRPNENYLLYTGEVSSFYKSKGRHYLNLVKPGTMSSTQPTDEALKLSAVSVFEYNNSKVDKAVYLLLTPKSAAVIPKSKLGV